MNKAFTSKDGHHADDEDFDLPEPEGAEALKGKNLMTPHGARKLQDELKQLRFVERPEITRIVSWAAGNGDRSENGDYLYGKKKLREIDRRIRYVSRRLKDVEIIDPLTIVSERVQFGATVLIRNEDDSEKEYRIVGIDEVDVGQGKISWVSPLGAALLKSSEGDIVLFRSPKGIREIEIVSVKYIEIV
jgi:transcription elongation factor GreB